LTSVGLALLSSAQRCGSGERQAQPEAPWAGEFRYRPTAVCICFYGFQSLFVIMKKIGACGLNCRKAGFPAGVFG
jgi:hypothetical protein